MKPQLDFDTVLEIIKMIEVRICYIENKGICDQYDYGTFDTLYDIKEHLQLYIEGLVSQAEFNLNAGE